MSENVKYLTDETFDDVVNNSDMPVLVDFGAPWCGPCNMIAPVIDEIADEYVGKAIICKVDTDESREAAIKFGITSIPTIIVFKNGELEKKWVGLIGKDVMTEAIDGLL